MSDLDICNKCFEDNKSCIEGLGDPHHPDDIYKLCREFKIIKLTKCVEFYAKPNSWYNSGNKNMNRMTCVDTSNETFERDGYTYNNVQTGGKLARQTLNEINKQ